MTGTLTAALVALTPIFLLIALGYGIRRSGLVIDTFWPAAETVTYWVFFPALLMGTLVRSDIVLADLIGMAFAMTLPILFLSAGLLALRPMLRGLDDPAFTSVLQSAIRPNTYVGLAAATALFGPDGLSLIAIGIAIVVPTVNIIAVWVLERFGSSPARRGGVLRGLVTNPIILAVAGGLILKLGGVSFEGHPIAEATGAFVGILGQPALPLGLLAVGAGLDPRAVGRAGVRVGASTLLKLVAAPALTLACGLAIGITPLQLQVAVLYNGLPVAASAYVLARQMGGDAPMLAGTITATTMFAAITIPFWMVLVL